MTDPQVRPTTRPKLGRPPSWLVNGVLFAVVAALFGSALYSSRASIREVLAGTPDVNRLVLAFVFMLSSVLITHVRWCWMIRALGVGCRYRDAIRLGLIGHVFNGLIPGAVAGDVLKAVFLARERGHRVRVATSVFMDRVVGVLGLCALAGLSGAWAWPTADPAIRRLAMVAWGATALGVAGLAALWAPAMRYPLARLAAVSPRLEHALNEWEVMAAAYRARPGVVLACFASALLSHGLLVLAFYCVGHALFTSVPTLAEQFLMVPMVLFSTTVPLPFGALGVGEQVSAALFRLADHPNGAVVMMGFRVLFLLVDLIGLGVYVANIQQIRPLSRKTLIP